MEKPRLRNRKSPEVNASFLPSGQLLLLNPPSQPGTSLVFRGTYWLSEKWYILPFCSGLWWEGVPLGTIHLRAFSCFICIQQMFTGLYFVLSSGVSAGGHRLPCPILECRCTSHWAQPAASVPPDYVILSLTSSSRCPWEILGRVFYRVHTEACVR